MTEDKDEKEFGAYAPHITDPDPDEDHMPMTAAESKAFAKRAREFMEAERKKKAAHADRANAAER
jgi:hypothetical protein